MAVGTVKIGDTREMQFRLQAEAKTIRPELHDTLDDIAEAMQNEARSMAGHKTGNLVRAIEAKKARRAGPKGTRATVEIDRKEAPYGVWVNEGTGLFGRRGRVIKAKTGNVMVFQGKKGLVFARTVKGQKGKHFMEKAFDLVMLKYTPARLERLADEVARF